MAVESVVQIIAASVTTIATVVIAVYARTQSEAVQAQVRALKQEKTNRHSKLDALAKRHALLLRRALRECVRTLDDNDPTMGDLTWTNAMARTSQALGGRVQEDLHKMLDAAIERSGGAAATLEGILEHYYSACDSFNELASGGGHMETETMTKHRNNARKRCIQCWGAMEEEFGLGPQQPRSFGKPGTPPSLPGPAGEGRK